MLFPLGIKEGSGVTPASLWGWGQLTCVLWEPEVPSWEPGVAWSTPREHCAFCLESVALLITAVTAAVLARAGGPPYPGVAECMPSDTTKTMVSSDGFFQSLL